jgi:hypothetical protein
MQAPPQTKTIFTAKSAEIAEKNENKDFSAISPLLAVYGF